MSRRIATTPEAAVRMFSSTAVARTIEDCKVLGRDYLRVAAEGAETLALEFENDAAKSRSLSNRDAWREAARRARQAAQQIREA